MSETFTESLQVRTAMKNIYYLFYLLNIFYFQLHNIWNFA